MITQLVNRKCTRHTYAGLHSCKRLFSIKNEMFVQNKTLCGDNDARKKLRSEIPQSHYINERIHDERIETQIGNGNNKVEHELTMRCFDSSISEREIFLQNKTH